MITIWGGELGHDESLSEQEILILGNMWVPSSVGGDSVPPYEHQGWVSTSCTLMQVSNVPSPNTNGKSQLSQPVSSGYVGGSLVAIQIARNPVSAPTIDLNVTVSVLVILMMLHGLDIDPQCFEKLSNCKKSPEHQRLKWRKVIAILCPSSTLSVQV